MKTMMIMVVMRKGVTGPEADETRKNDKVLDDLKVRVAGETKGESDEVYDGDEEAVTGK
jgi:hypothetical protein